MPDAVPAAAPSAPANGAKPGATTQPATPAPSKGQAAASVPAADAKETQAEAARRLKLDLGEGEKEYDLDTIRANYLKGKNAAQLESKASKKLQEAQSWEKKQADFQALLEKNPQKAFEALGYDKQRAMKLAEDLLLPEIQSQAMSPEQREIADLKARLAAQDEERKGLAQRQEEAQLEQLTQQHLDSLAGQFVAALEKSGMPAQSAPFAVKRLAAVWERNMELDAEDRLTPDECANIVREDFRAEHKSLTETLDGQGLVEWLGEEAVKKIRRFDLARLKSRNGQPAQPQQRPGMAPQRTETTKKSLSRDEWEALIQERIGGGG